MATEFVCKIGWSGAPDRDFKTLALWTITCHCDLTAATTKVYSSTRTSGTSWGVAAGVRVYLYRGGVLQDCTAWLLYATATQVLLKDITGTVTPQSGDVWIYDLNPIYGYVTILNSGDSAIAVAACYNDAYSHAIEDLPRLLEWKTNTTNYIKIYTPTSERHTGKAGTGYCLSEPHPDSLLVLNDVDVHIQGLEFEGGGMQIEFNYRDTTAHLIKIEACIFHDNLWNSLIFPGLNPMVTAWIWNCVLYNGKQGAIATSYGTIRVENCTIYDPGIGYGVGSGVCYNTVAHRNFQAFAAFGPGCTGDHNCDGIEAGTDGSAPGAHSLHNKELSDILWKRTYDDRLTFSTNDVDLNIEEESCLVGTGQGRSTGPIGFSTDIIGTVRTGAWTIGAFQTWWSSSSSSSMSSSSSSFSSVSYSSSSSASSSSSSSSLSSSSSSLSSSSSSFSSSSSPSFAFEPWFRIRDYAY